MQTNVDTKGIRTEFMFKIKLTYNKRELILVGDVTSNHIIRILWDLVSYTTIILKAARSFGHSRSGGRQFFWLQFPGSSNGLYGSNGFRHFLNAGFQFGLVIAGDWLSDWNGRFDDFTGDCWSDWESGAG